MNHFAVHEKLIQHCKSFLALVQHPVIENKYKWSHRNGARGKNFEYPGTANEEGSIHFFTEEGVQPGNFRPLVEGRGIAKGPQTHLLKSGVESEGVRQGMKLERTPGSTEGLINIRTVRSFWNRAMTWSTLCSEKMTLTAVWEMDRKGDGKRAVNGPLQDF